MADVVKGLAVATIGYHIVLTTLLAVTGWYVWNLHGEVIELSSYIHDVKEFRRAAIPHTRNPVNEGRSEDKIQKRQAEVPSWVVGPPGPPGRDGRDGLPGTQGPPGPAGKDAVSFPQIDQHISFAIADIVTKERENLREAARDIPGVAGGVYTRWGHKDCPDSASMVYRGDAGGSWYLSGGGSNIQCFPEDPLYLNTTSSATESLIFGVEYEVFNNQYFDSVKHMREKNVPCVVCQPKHRATVLMSPATTKCHDDSWTFEYNGYLMSGGRGHQRATFICVDKEPQAVDGQDNNGNGELIFHTSIDCHNFGSCPPYRNNAELACVVCSK